MLGPKTSIGEILVHLVRVGVGAGDYCLPEGATLADLLRVSEISATGQDISVNGTRLEESLSLHDGTVVTLVPKPDNPPAAEPWRAQIRSFLDEGLFQEYREALQARRDEDTSEGDSKA